jgi:deoxyribose-phosphate aldolase
MLINIAASGPSLFETGFLTDEEAVGSCLLASKAGPDIVKSYAGL